ncbi:MAG: hypothetical protein AAF943_04935 [Pseudomonadota bacterium]
MLTRWREVLIGLALACGGIYVALGSGPLLAMLSYAVSAGGIILTWLGVQRGRFRGADGGAGVVQVDEGQVTYFGPLSGGAVALREMESLILDGTMHPAHWQLIQPGQDPLTIPVDAAGAEALFDAFTSLPGLKTERMLGSLQQTPPQAVVIWHRGPLRPEGALLH